jgi:16S rRNA (uracil1498-N3)-methyltransferase
LRAEGEAIQRTNSTLATLAVDAIPAKGRALSAGIRGGKRRTALGMGGGSDEGRVAARVFVAGDLAEDRGVALEPGAVHHLRTVLRLRPGGAVALFNGRDGEWLARLESLGRSDGVARCLGRRRPQEPSADVWLCAAPVKRARIDLLVEKATELGVAVIQPVLTARTGPERIGAARLHAHAVAAAEQSGRLTVPEIRDPVGLDLLLADWPAARALIACVEAGPARPVADVLPPLAGRPGAILVGPEGGFAARELDGLAELPFVHCVRLGRETLRAETAAFAALACWQALAGDWRALLEPSPAARIGEPLTGRRAR